MVSARRIFLLAAVGLPLASAVQRHAREVGADLMPSESGLSSAVARLYPHRKPLAATKHVASPLSNVLLLLGHPRGERKEALEGYMHYFWDVWYLKPKEHFAPGIDCALYESLQCVADVMRGEKPKKPFEMSTNAMLFRMMGKNAELGSFMNQEGELRHVKGVMYMHFDFWINPKVFMENALDLRKLWRPNFGLMRNFSVVQARCKRGEELQNDNEYNGGWYSVEGWGNVFKPNGLKLVSQAIKDGMPSAQGWHEDELCYGWSDLFYIPRAGWSEYAALSDRFVNLFHEVAIPTIQAMLVRSGIVEGEEVMNCMGCCCCQVNDPDKLHGLCGHQIRLDHEEMSFAMKKMLDPSFPADSSFRMPDDDNTYEDTITNLTSLSRRYRRKQWKKEKGVSDWKQSRWYLDRNLRA